MEKFPKFIIESDEEIGICLIISKVIYHKEIANNLDMIQGGGWFRMNYDDKIITFHGDSHDFGAASLEHIKEAVDNDKVFTNKRLTHSIAKEFKFLYDTQSEIIPLN